MHMIEMLLGFGLGAMAFTEQGRAAGNKAAQMAMQAAKKVMENAAVPPEPAKRTAGAAGDAGDPGKPGPEPVERVLQRPTRKEPGSV